MTQTVLATLPDSTSRCRLLVLLGQRRDGRLVLELRKQEYADGVGWFDQRSLELEPRQFKQLQGILGQGREARAPAVARRPARPPFPRLGTPRSSASIPQGSAEGEGTFPLRIFREGPSRARSDRVEG